jgi:hypothetical protein
MAGVWSARFLAQQGLSGTGDSVTVPGGHTYVVKQITAYASPILSVTRVFFQDGDSGAALWSAQYIIEEAGWAGFYGQLVFKTGSSFHFQVDNLVDEAADVYCGGYDLLDS